MPLDSVDKMVRDTKALLIRSVGENLVPEIVKLGFEATPTPKDEGSEILRAFPFGRFRRRISTGIDIVEIQFDKYGAAAFRFNLGAAPEGGVDTVTGHIEQNDIWVHYLEAHFALYDSSFRRKWFSVTGRFGKEPTTADCDEVVFRAVRLLPEVDRLFRTGARGRHIHLVR